MRRALSALTVCALAIATLGACGGDDDSADDARDALEAVDDVTAPDGDDDGADDLTDVTTGDDEYDALLEQARTASFRVTYRSSGGGDEFTISQDPPNVAFITGGGASFIRTGDEIVSCSGEGAAAQCFVMPDDGMGIDAMVQGFFGMYSVLLATSDEADGLGGLGFDVETSDDEEIAGRDAKCAEVEAGELAGGDGRYKVCVDAETGVLLLGESEGGGETSTIEAIEYGEPQASDFEPPAEPTSLDVPAP
jgi:hypothetical protein